MGKFLEDEKRSQEQFKRKSRFFSDAARSDGVYRGKARPFCVPLAYAEENLMPEIRVAALQHFAAHQINWHDGKEGKPSNHLCDSQVCCVNFLFFFADKPGLLKEVLLPVFPEIDQMLPVEDGLFVSFEWIGEKNYLGERVSKNEARTRGANSTSADAIAMFRRKDGNRQIVLIEWKYTESYSGFFCKISTSGTDRSQIYQHLFGKSDCPFDTAPLPNFDALFYEPFYQFMRQQFLANEMENAREMGADLVSVLHISPAHNHEFLRVTSPYLTSIGSSATSTWTKLVKRKGSFTSVSSERLFGGLGDELNGELTSWRDYIYSRYPWVITGL